VGMKLGVRKRMGLSTWMIRIFSDPRRIAGFAPRSSINLRTASSPRDTSRHHSCEWPRWRRRSIPAKNSARTLFVARPTPTLFMTPNNAFSENTDRRTLKGAVVTWPSIKREVPIKYSTYVLSSPRRHDGTGACSPLGRDQSTTVLIVFTWRWGTAAASPTMD
jgi:hypothetical protein